MESNGSVENLVGFISNNNYLTLTQIFNITPIGLEVTNSNEYLDNIFAFGTFNEQSIVINLGYKSGDTVTAWECGTDCIADNDWNSWNEMTQIPDLFLSLVSGENIQSSVDSDMSYTFTVDNQLNQLEITKGQSGIS